MNDLFQPARARATDPDTSHAAAEAVAPFTGTIREQVNAFAKSKGQDGFIDEELSAHFQDSEHSSYRTRRAELVERNVILDSGRRRNNSNGLACVVWVHREHVLQPPPEREGVKLTKTQAKTEAETHIAALASGARQMKNEGRALFAAELDAACDFIRRLNA
jgi:hypothetical protein